MTYEIYKNILEREQFFERLGEESQEAIPASMKDLIYSRYVVKSLVFQRDNFKCQNLKCKTPKSKITWHHIKFRKNGGKDTLKNTITVCLDCHQNYHKGKIELAFPNATYKLHKETKINWKLVKKASKKIRKDNIKFSGIKISWELACILMKFLSINHEEMEEE